MKWDNIPRLARSFFKTPPPAIVVVFRSICRTVSSQSFPQSHCFYFLFSLNCGWGALRQLHPLIQHLWTSTQSSFYPWDQLHLFRTYINCLVNSAFGFTAWNIFLECTEYLWEQFYQLKFKHVLAGGGGISLHKHSSGASSSSIEAFSNLDWKAVPTMILKALIWKYGTMLVNVNHSIFPRILNQFNLVVY